MLVHQRVTPWIIDASFHSKSDLPDLVGLCQVRFRHREGNHPADLAGERFIHMGLSENSVPLNPMVNDHYPH